MPFGHLTFVGLRICALEGDQDRANPFVVARGDKSVMRLITKLLWTHVYNYLRLFNTRTLLLGTVRIRPHGTAPHRHAPERNASGVNET